MFLNIVTTVTLPLILLIGVGYVSVAKLTLDVQSLGRLLIYVILPCSLIHFLTATRLPLGDSVYPAVFTVFQYLAAFALAWSVSPLLRIEAAFRNIFAAAVAFPNSGNFGIPLINLSFGEDWILHQSIITGIHTCLIVFTAAFLLSPARRSLSDSSKQIFQTPLVPAIVIGILIKSMEISIPAPVAIPLAAISGALTPLALIILGGQLATSRLEGNHLPVYWIVFFAIVAVPAFTWIALQVTGASADMTAFLTVGACTPVGVVLAILISDQPKHAAMVTAAVVVSTALSPVVVTLAIIGLRL